MKLSVKYSKLYSKGLLGLFLGCVVGSTFAGIIEVYPSFEYMRVFSFLINGTLFGFLLGGIVLGLYGLPVYIALIDKNVANFLTVIAAGSLPGILAFSISSKLGLLVFLFGCPTALFMHILCMRSGLVETLTRQ
ncbi:hypothetical protein [Aliikangiella sp. IMCC44359]|uniref:hypothetical protein n=1 Tax=Aliikangiella sp. IMCC44359 TaxID=3459125 RepID=UPI00403ACDD7